MQEESDDKFSANIFWLVGVESGLESDVLLVIHPLEVILLGWLRNKSVNITKRIFFITESIIRGNDQT